MKKIIKQWTVPVLCGLIIFFLFKCIFFIGYVPTESMEPVIKTGSCIFGHRIIGEICQGDILVFNVDKLMIVKRVAAVPGNVVYIDDTGEIISVNEAFPDATQILIVPDNCYFMLGDNADTSNDSRFWEEPFIKKTQIIAKVWK